MPQERTFTPEQRRVLGRLYGFLISVGEKRLRRLALEKEQAEKAGQPGENTESGTAHQAGEQG
jgi:hypothetical protein